MYSNEDDLPAEVFIAGPAVSPDLLLAETLRMESFLTEGKKVMIVKIPKKGK